MDNMNIQRLAENLNKIIVDEMLIRVANYKGEYHLENGEFTTIQGELYIRTNSDTIFRVISKNGIVDDFDVLGDAKLTSLVDSSSEDYITQVLKLDREVSLEIEDTNGNTIGGANLKTGEHFGNFTIADVDGDYIFDSDNILVRIQLD